MRSLIEENVSPLEHLIIKLIRIDFFILVKIVNFLKHYLMKLFAVYRLSNHGFLSSVLIFEIAKVVNFYFPMKLWMIIFYFRN